jgi:glycosyltransferase involved in cell wall biosynthesis
VAHTVSDPPEAARPSPTPRLEGRRIVFVLNYAVLGGAERQSLLLASHLAEREGAEVAVCALTDAEGTAATLFRERGIPWHTAPLSWTDSPSSKVHSLLRLAARLRRLRPDVLMPYCAVPDVACGLVWPLTGASLCVWNQQDVNPSTRVSGSTLHRAVRRTPRFVGNSRHAAEFVIALGAPRQHVQVIHTAVELAEPQADRSTWRDRLGLTEDDFVVCSLAHLHRFKDHDTLLRAWRIASDELAGEDRGAVLLLAGRPAGAEDQAKALAFDLHLGSSVRFLGEVHDVSGLLGAADLGVLSSRAEGCPNAVLECMAAGLAVAGTDIPGLREPLGDDGSGLLARPGDAEGLAGAFVKAARDPDLRRVLGERNRRRADEEFTLERAVEARVALFREGLAQASRRR